MGGTEKSIVIKASPEKVWEMLPLDRYPEWTDMMVSVEYTSEVRTPQDKYRVGATALGTPKGGSTKQLSLRDNRESQTREVNATNVGKVGSWNT